MRHKRARSGIDIAPQSFQFAATGLAVQAFLPGMILLLRMVARNGQRVSPWFRDRVELEMRSLNGGLAALWYGRSLLTDIGRELCDCLLNDYDEFLEPAYTEVHALLRLSAISPWSGGVN